MAVRTFRITSFRIDGRPYSVEKDSIGVERGRIDKEEVMGLNELEGIKEGPKAPKIKAKLIEGDYDPSDIEQLTNMTVAYTRVDGKTFALQGAYAVLGDENPHAGTIEVEFTGQNIVRT
jgi:hypothetical protein